MTTLDKLKEQAERTGRLQEQAEPSRIPITFIEHVIDKHPKGKPSLKALALAVEENPKKIYRVAKYLYKGRQMRKRENNWYAIDNFLRNRMADPTDIAQLTAIVSRAHEIDIELTAKDRRRTGTGFYSQVKDIELKGGKWYPKRREAYMEFQPESDQEPNPLYHNCLGLKGIVYRMVYQSETHSLLREIDENEAFVNEMPKLTSNIMLNTQAEFYVEGETRITRAEFFQKLFDKE